ncbi:MAG: ABC transporter permease [Deltaproteobacteria bacterium]
MKLYFKIFYESILQAKSQLVNNKLRTILSLLGITIGIFSIVIVKTAVDSLESNIKTSFAKLGTDIVYIDKMPWNENPRDNYWKYRRRPDIDFKDYKAIKKNVKHAKLSTFTLFVAGKTIKYKSSSVEGAYILAPTWEFGEMMKIDFAEGRYFTRLEYNQGLNKVILGYNIANELFKGTNPVNKVISFYGQKFNVIGVINKEGDNIVNVMPFDDAIMLNYNTARKFIDVKDPFRTGRMLSVQAYDDKEISKMTDEIVVAMRKVRSLKPLEENNFAVNESSLFMRILDSVFASINIAGFFIGIFALIVGMVSIANIMFVSVKERTNIIGIKKAIGARRIVILSEFLIEAIILSLTGGIVGIIMVWGSTKIINNFVDFTMFLSIGNIIYGVLWSIGVGIIAGFWPAFKASKLDPVEAIRR